MEKKKIWIHIIVLIIAFLLFALWYEDKKNQISDTSLQMETEPSDMEQIYFISMNKQNQFWHILDQGASDMARLLGVDYRWEAPEERNAEEQIKVFNDVVSAGADAILLAAVDPEAIAPAVEAAKEKGIKIIYVDSPSAEKGVTTLATDNYTAGRYAGMLMLEELTANNIQSGSIGIVSVSPEITTTARRENGFRDVIKEDGKFALIDTKYTNSDEPQVAQTLATEIIKENPDLVGIFSTNEDTTIGLGSAIAESGDEIIGAGFDVTKSIEVLLKDDILQATLVQNPYTMGYLGVAQAVAALRGHETGPEFINTGVSILTPNTVGIHAQ